MLDCVGPVIHLVQYPLSVNHQHNMFQRNMQEILQ